MTVKDALETAGLVTTSGAPELRTHVPGEDAVAVQRALDAGAIVLGKTNLPLYAGDWQTFNEVYGRTNNPWDVTRTVGGSSGGSAASIAAGFVPLEIGSDIGGSIRTPANYCGVYGHKPSHGIVPGRGHIPGPPGTKSEPDLAVVGPLARTAGDLRLALDVIAGPDMLVRGGWALTLPPSRAEKLQDFRVACWLDEGIKTDLVTKNAARGMHLSHADWNRAHEARTRLRWQCHELFRDIDVLLTPVGPVTAFPHQTGGNPLSRKITVNGQNRPYMDHIPWIALATSAFLPATSAPVGVTPDGLPVNIQIIGPHLGDKTTIRFAELLANVRGGFQQPPAL